MHEESPFGISDEVVNDAHEAMMGFAESVQLLAEIASDIDTGSGIDLKEISKLQRRSRSKKRRRC